MAEEKQTRPSWDQYFRNIMREVGKRSTCDRGKVGAVMTKENRIVATGYAGSPKGMPHCDEVGHLMKKSFDENGNIKENCVRTTHAEQNAITQAALHGVSIDGATVYVPMEPCLVCAKMLINAGIKKIVCEKKYHDAELSRQFLKQAGIELIVLGDETMQYPQKS